MIIIIIIIIIDYNKFYKICRTNIRCNKDDNTKAIQLSGTYQ